MARIKFFDRKFFNYAVSLGIRKYPELYVSIPIFIFSTCCVLYNDYYLKNVIGTNVSQYKSTYFVYRQGDIETYLYPKSYITDKENLLPDHPETGKETLKKLPKAELKKSQQQTRSFSDPI